MFVDFAEKELWRLFESIDRNHNGEIDKDELRTAFSKAGVTVSSAKFDEFFQEVDTNRDGVITYEEWRYAHTGQVQLVNHPTDHTQGLPPLLARQTVVRLARSPLILFGHWKSKPGGRRPHQ